MILMSQKGKMCSRVDKAMNREAKPAVMYDYIQNMEAIHLKYQMLQPYLLR
jgi:hypothetical protein